MWAKFWLNWKISTGNPFLICISKALNQKGLGLSAVLELRYNLAALMDELAQCSVQEPQCSTNTRVIPVGHDTFLVKFTVLYGCTKQNLFS